MNAQTIPQTSTTVRQTLVRYRWAIAFGLLIVVAALVTYCVASVPAVATPVVSGSQVLLVDPAQQGVLAYVWAHQAVAETQPLDPAQQSVLSYVHIHGNVEALPAPAGSLDSAQQSVMSYLRAHNTIETRPLDPAQQGVMDYLRAHNK